jgi:tetratricopeptide (TPR) repeat protein
MRVVALLLLLGAAAACSPTGGTVGRGITVDDPLAPPGVAPDAEARAVDPLIVGDRLMRAGEPELALDAYIRAAARDGLTPGVSLSLASANIALGRLGQAEDLLRGVLEDDPENAAALNDLGVVLIEKGEVGEAHGVLRAAFALQPDPEILANLRIAATSLASRTYPDPVEDDAFTLTRRAGGVYQLSPPGPQ